MELTKQKNYQQAFDLACACFKEMDPEERARKAGGIYQKEEDGGKIIVDFFSEPTHLHFPRMEFDSPQKKTISLVTRVLILHYLLRAEGTPLAGRWIGYKEIPGGLLYAGVFARRVTEPLARKFGRSAKGFKEAGWRLGGASVDVGDASLSFLAFPRVPLQYILWEGDDEFSAAAQLLFDASVEHYLSLEDIVVLGQVVTGRLIHQSTLFPQESPHPKEN